MKIAGNLIAQLQDLHFMDQHRIESAKQIFGLGFHPKGFTHPHYYSHVNALTFGAVRDLPIAGMGRFGVGGDVTWYPMMRDVLDLYEGSHSFHVFLRWRPTAAPTGHVH